MFFKKIGSLSLFNFDFTVPSNNLSPIRIFIPAIIFSSIFEDNITFLFNFLERELSISDKSFSIETAAVTSPRTIPELSSTIS